MPPIFNIPPSPKKIKNKDNIVDDLKIDTNEDKKIILKTTSMEEVDNKEEKIGKDENFSSVENILSGKY